MVCHARRAVLVVLVASMAVASSTAQGSGPGFSLQPSDAWVFEGQPIQFTVGLTGSPTPTCQWQASSDLGQSWSNLSNTPPYSGVTSTQLMVSTTTLAMSATQFRCLATNSQGSLASHAATLSVAVNGPPPPPMSGSWTGTFPIGGSLSFGVDAGTSVTSFTYSTSLGCVSGPYGPIVVPLPISGNAFGVAGAGGNCPSRSIAGLFTSATTAIGTVTHAFSNWPTPCPCLGSYQTGWTASFGPPAPQFRVQPANQTVAVGQNVRFTVAASGTPNPAFRWQLSMNGGATWTDVPTTSPYSGATTPTLTILGSGLSGLNGSLFRARAQNSAGTTFSDPATLTVTGGGSAPTTVNDSYATAFNTALAVGPPGVLGNDHTNGGGAMTAALVTTTANGVLTLNANGSVNYVPNAGFTGPDTFTYRAVNTIGPGNMATVTITVGSPPPPTSVNDSYGTAFETTLTVAAPGVLGNDASNGGGPLSAVLVGHPASGTLSLSATGAFSYTPNAGFSGADSFTYRAVTAAGPGNVATVSIAVAAPNTPLAPVNLVASAIAGPLVTLRWTMPGGGPVPTGFVVEGGVGPGEVLASLPTGSAFPIFTFAAPAGSFHVRVHALSGALRSAASNEIRIHVNVPVGPSAPANLLGLVNGSNLSLAWTNTYAGGAPSSMLLDVSGSVVTSLPLGMADSFTFAGVPGGTYTLALRAQNAGGVGPPSNPVTLTFPGPCSGPPAVPAGALAYRVGNTVFVEWAPGLGGFAPTSFVLNVTGSFVGSFSTSGRAMSGTVGAGSYTLSVTAVNACGASPATPPQTVVVP